MVLSPKALGPLPLSKGAKVSEGQLRKLFPEFKVKYKIASGDSPDFHYFTVSDNAGDILFSIKSFMDKPTRKTTAPVPISLLQVYSRKIEDSYGIQVGDRVSDIIKKRGRALDFGASHFKVYLGSGRIFYNIATGSEWSSERLTKEDAEKGNWPIVSISWPESAWE
jgi:hypothetical protein